MSRSRLAIARGTAAALVAAALTLGCGMADNRPDGRGLVSSTVSVAYCCDEWLMAPHWGMPAKHMVFLPLTATDEHGDVVGRLARSWEHSPDYREWTVHLRSDVRWHDGRPVTAHDVAWTLDFLRHPEVMSQAADAYEVTVVDDTTYRIRYERQGAGSPLDDYTVYYPRHLLEGLDPAKFAEWEFWKSPVGNGPYRYVRHQAETMMELEANPDFYAGKPPIDRVFLKFISEAPVTGLLAGQLDVAPNVNRLDVLRLRGDPRLVAYPIPPPHRAEAIFWEHGWPPFDDPRVRRAATLAIDRREILRALELPADLPLTDVIYTPRQFLRRDLPPALEPDSAEAVRLLEAAGWRDRDGDGIRDRGGEPFRFTALATQGSDAEPLAVLVQAQLRRFGIAMELQLLAGDAMARWSGGREVGARFRNHMMLAPGSGAASSATWFGRESRIGYRRLEVAERLEAMAETMNPDLVDALHREIWPYFQEDLPATFLHPVVWWTVADRRIRGLGREHVLDPVMFMEELWVEENQ